MSVQTSLSCQVLYQIRVLCSRNSFDPLQYGYKPWRTFYSLDNTNDNEHQTHSKTPTGLCDFVECGMWMCQKQTKGSRRGGCTSPAEAVCFFSCVSLYVHFQEDMDQYMGQVLRSLSSPYLLTRLSETDKSIEQWRACSLLFGNGGATSWRHRSEIAQGLKTVLSWQRAELLIHTMRRVMFPCQHGELLRDSQWVREDVYQHVNEGLQNEQISLDVLKTGGSPFENQNQPRADTMTRCVFVHSLIWWLTTVNDSQINHF